MEMLFKLRPELSDKGYGVEICREGDPMNKGDWSFKIKDYDDETVFDVYQISLDGLIMKAARELRAQLVEQASQLEHLLQKSAVLLPRD